MFSAVVSGFNSILYTLLAFVFPLYFTVKALLRQYTVSIVPTSFASASVNETDCAVPVSVEDSDVPASFIEAVNSNVNNFKSTFNSAAINSSAAVATAPSISSAAWLHYWAILAVVHCFTGIYERIILPFVGNSLIYHCAKYAGIYWLAKDEAKASRALWTAVVAPFAAKYEKEVDRLLQVAGQQARVMAAKSIASLRQIRARSVKIPLKVD